MAHLRAHSRRTWMKTAAMGMGGLLASERNLAAQPVNHACALADPRDEIKITETGDHPGQLAAQHLCEDAHRCGDHRHG